MDQKLEFTIEKEIDGKINFLDVTITRKTNQFGIDIYRKPTYTDNIIPNDSCHPFEQKLAAIRYLNNRMLSYQLPPEDIEKERNTIKKILINNKYDTKILETINSKKQKEESGERTQWAKFTYAGKETRNITKLFKNTNVKIAFSTNNTIEKLLRTEHRSAKDKYEKSGIYRLTCPTCNMKYVGQTGRSFRIRFQEHFRDFKYGNKKSKFATHLLDNRHAIDSMENIMETTHITNKGKMMDTIEKFYIYRETKIDNQINDRLTIKSNVIFETVVQEDKHRGIITTQY